MPVITAGTPVNTNYEERTTLKTFWQKEAPEGTAPATKDEAPLSGRVLFFQGDTDTWRGKQPTLAFEIQRSFNFYKDSEDMMTARKLLRRSTKFTTSKHNQLVSHFVVTGRYQIENVLGAIEVGISKGARQIISNDMLTQIRQQTTDELTFKRNETKKTETVLEI